MIILETLRGKAKICKVRLIYNLGNKEGKDRRLKGYILAASQFFGPKVVNVKSIQIRLSISKK